MLILFVTIPCVLAQALPDPPKVTVDPAILQKFGITEDVNQPGLFQHLVSIHPGINYTHIGNIHNIYLNRLDLSPIQFSKALIDIYRPHPEAVQAQFVAAHILNVYMRLDNIINKINDDAILSFQKFIANKDSESRQALCTNASSIFIAASYFTREIRISDACREFNPLVANEPTLVLSLLGEAVKCKESLTEVTRLLQKEDVPFHRIVQFVRINPVIPSLYHNELAHQLTIQFEDYSKFLNSIPHSPMTKIIPAFPPKSVWNSAFASFLSDLQLAPANVLE